MACGSAKSFRAHFFFYEKFCAICAWYACKWVDVCVCARVLGELTVFQYFGTISTRTTATTACYVHVAVHSHCGTMTRRMGRKFSLASTISFDIENVLYSQIHTSHLSQSPFPHAGILTQNPVDSCRIGPATTRVSGNIHRPTTDLKSLGVKNVNWHTLYDNQLVWEIYSISKSFQIAVNGICYKYANGLAASSNKHDVGSKARFCKHSNCNASACDIQRILSQRVVLVYTTHTLPFNSFSFHSVA